MAGVPYHLWFKFCWPLIVKLMLAASVVLVLAVVFDYGADVQPQQTSQAQTIELAL
jgi:hypothetical protein